MTRLQSSLPPGYTLKQRTIGYYSAWVVYRAGGLPIGSYSGRLGHRAKASIAVAEALEWIKQAQALIALLRTPRRLAP